MKKYLLLQITFFFLTSGHSQMKPHSLPFDTSFNRLAADIIAQDRIFEMDDCTRHTKKVNDQLVFLGDAPRKEDTLFCYLFQNCPKPITFVLDSFKIEKRVFDDFRNKLQATKLREFCKFDNKVLFVVDGFLDHSWGFVYSAKDQIRLEDEWMVSFQNVRVIEVVNKYWAKVAIN